MQCGPYSTTLGDCHKPGASAESLDEIAYSRIDKFSKSGDIDPLDDFKKVAAYIVGGTKDPTVPLFAVEAINDLFNKYGVEKHEFLKKPIKHDTAGSKPIDGLKYIYDQLGYYPTGF